MKKRMKKISIFCLTGMLALGLWACSSSKDGSADSSTSETAKIKDSSEEGSKTEKNTGNSSEEQEIGENGFPVNIPQFTTKDMDGNKVTNDIFAEYDLTVVNFWATYCNPCIDELPELAEWKKELPDNVNLIGLLVDVDEKGSEQYKLAEKIISQTGADYQHLIATEEFDDIISNLVGVPTTFFVDSTGKIIGEPFAGADVSAYKQTVEDYLNGK
ncbi:MAG: TlpA disulfide reductase family protein [Dorea sp.]